MSSTRLPVFAALPKPTREQEAAWSTAGQRLYAEAGVTLAHEGATHAEELGASKALFRALPPTPDAGNFAVSPDGQRFLVSPEGAFGAPNELHLLVNWPSHLAGR